MTEAAAGRLFAEGEGVSEPRSTGADVLAGAGAAHVQAGDNICVVGCDVLLDATS